MLIEITRKKILIFVGLLLVILAVPLTVYVSQRQQETRSKAATPIADSTVIVTLNGEDITKGEVTKVAEEQFSPEAIDNQVLEDSLNVLEERKILDIEAQKQGVSLDSSAVSTRMVQQNLSKNQSYYDSLRERMTLINVKSRLVISISAWTPTLEDQTSLSDADKVIAQTQTEDALLAFPQIQKRLSAGDDAVQIANDTVTKYPSLADSLAINGYKLTDLDDSAKETNSTPKIVEFGDSNMDQTTLDALFAMEVGDVKTVTETETNAAGSVFKIIEIGNDSGEDTYKDWLTKQKQALIIPRSSL